MDKRIRKRERGFVLVVMGVSAVAIFGGLGLSVDLGRMYITRSELQTFCDAAALTAATNLDGTSGGLTRATAAVTNSTNSYNFNTALISHPIVEFSSNGTSWSASPGSAQNQSYVRVRVTASVSLFFLPYIVGSYAQNVGASAAAAQIQQTNMQRGLAPYTAVAQDMSAVNFGLQVGEQYDLQWPQYNGSRAGCGPNNPDKCFNSPPCSGDTKAARASVVQNWGSSINGYWGGNANRDIYEEVLDLVQLQPVTINQVITMSTGNKNVEAAALDARANQDVNHSDNTVSGYLASTHNGRRLMALPIVNPQVDSALVVGYGAFLLVSNGNPSNYYQSGNGNDPFCAIYAGAYVQGASTTGVTFAGSYKVQLVQ